jgi:hypothetical protein
MQQESHMAEPDSLDPVVASYLRDVDQTLIQRNLTLSVEERFRQLMELQAFAAELGLQTGCRDPSPWPQLHADLQAGRCRSPR